jgi:hypothetical protein
LEIRINADDMGLLKGNVLDVLDPDLAEVVEKAEVSGGGFLLRFPSEDAAEAFLDVVAEESNHAIGALPGQFDDLLDRVEEQIDRGGAKG